MTGESKPRRWRWPLISLVLVVVVLIAWFIYLLRQPGTTVATVTIASEEAAAIEPVVVDGRYWRFSYPSNWTLNWHDQTPKGGYLERAQVSVSVPHPYRLVVSVETVDEVFDEIPAIMSRRLGLNGQYIEREAVYGGRTFTEFQLVGDGYERTIFLMIDNRLYVMSLTAAVNYSEGNEIFDQYAAGLAIK